jgi:hypothetical protein
MLPTASPCLMITPCVGVMCLRCRVFRMVPSTRVYNLPPSRDKCTNLGTLIQSVHAFLFYMCFLNAFAVFSLLSKVGAASMLGAGQTGAYGRRSSLQHRLPLCQRHYALGGERISTHTQRVFRLSRIVILYPVQCTRLGVHCFMHC